MVWSEVFRRDDINLPYYADFLLHPGEHDEKQVSQLVQSSKIGAVPPLISLNSKPSNSLAWSFKNDLLIILNLKISPTLFKLFGYRFLFANNIISKH